MDAEGGTVHVWQDSDNWLSHIWDLGRPTEKVALEIPQSLCEQSLTADLSVDAGSLDIKADLDSTTAEVRAGSLSMSGASNVVTVNVAAGSADLNIDDVEQVAVEVKSGSVGGTFTQVPERLTANIGAGSEATPILLSSEGLTQFVAKLSLDSIGSALLLLSAVSRLIVIVEGFSQLKVRVFLS